MNSKLISDSESKKQKDEKNKTSGDVLNSQSSADGKILNDFDFFPLLWDARETRRIWLSGRRRNISAVMTWTLRFMFDRLRLRHQMTLKKFNELSIINQNILYLIAEAVSCNQCSKTQKCLPDLMTHQPKCVICNYKCPRKRRPATVSFFYYRESPFAKTFKWASAKNVGEHN